MKEDFERYSVMKTLLRIMPIQFAASPFHNIAVCVMGIIHALFFSFTVVATQRLFDAVSAAAAGNSGFYDCLIPLLVLSGITFGQQIINGVSNFHAGVFFTISKGKFKSLLHGKLTRTAPENFEDTGFLDGLDKAREGLEALPFCANLFIMLICFYGTYFAFIGAYLFSLKPVLLLTLLFAFIPSLLGQIFTVKIFTALENSTAPLRREHGYYQKTLCDREYFKETRILGAYRFFRKLFEDTLVLLNRKTWQAERKTALLHLLLNTASFAGMAAASYILFDAAMGAEISLGAFAAIFSALGQVFNIMQEIIGHFGNFNKNAGKIANFLRMLDMPERTGAAAVPDFCMGITADNISFTYPGRDTPAVSGVSLVIANGETVAVVGENGAGKSTLVRLLTGIYRPSSGTVTVGGVNSSETSPAFLYKGISGVFQKYQMYKMTLAENVSISDAEAEADTARIEAALREADAETGTGPGTMLSPEFDGIDLSGGQWQRVAIARGLYRSSGFIVLDEPTSAIDPIEETRIYNKFRKLAEGKCAVVVTHRLGSAKLAKRIIVMESGQISDMGTHEQLLSRPGKYADMWAAQAKWYERAGGLR